MEFSSFDGAENGEHNCDGAVEILDIFVMQDDVFYESASFYTL